MAKRTVTGPIGPSIKPKGYFANSEFVMWLRGERREYVKETLEEVVRVALIYDAESKRDDPAHRGRMSKRESSLCQAIQWFNEADKPIDGFSEEELKSLWDEYQAEKWNSRGREDV